MQTSKGASSDFLLTKWRKLVGRIVPMYLLTWLGCPPVHAQTTPSILTNGVPSTGFFVMQQNVTISAASGTVYFTLDGSTPTNASTPYTSPIAITTPTQINAVSYLSGSYSSVTSAFVDVDPNLLPLWQIQLFPALRLRSDFGVFTNNTTSPPLVTNWIDLSGTAVTVTNNTATAPLKAAISQDHPVVRFNGASNLAVSQGRFGDGYTGAAVFIVMKPNTLAAGSRIFDFAATSGYNQLMRISDTGSLGQYSTYTATTPTSVFSSAALTQGQFQLLEAYQAKNSPYAGTFVQNGIPGTSGSMDLLQSGLRNVNFLGQDYLGGNHLDGDIAEVLMYYSNVNNDSSLTASQRCAIETLLMQKYQILSQVPLTPTISIPTSTLLQPAQVVVSSDAGSNIYITTDGSTPTSSSTPYNGQPLQINYTQTVKAIAIKNGVSSSVSSATYTLDSTQWPAPSGSDVTAPTINVDLPSPSL